MPSWTWLKIEHNWAKHCRFCFFYTYPVTALAKLCVLDGAFLGIKPDFCFREVWSESKLENPSIYRSMSFCSGLFWRYLRKLCSITAVPSINLFNHVINSTSVSYSDSYFQIFGYVFGNLSLHNCSVTFVGSINFPEAIFDASSF